MAPILYKMDGSPPARSAMMVADLLGLELEMRDLNPVLREQDQLEFLKVTKPSFRSPMQSSPPSKN